MKIIADAGSTKTKWCIIDGGASRTVRASGLNPATMSQGAIMEVVADEFVPAMGSLGEPEVFYYGAGVVSDVERAVIANALQLLCPARVTVESDMLGAARAILGHEPGVACILGTGSNTCLYDGTHIVDNVPALGYILGDEGSGGALGRRFVGDLFKRMLPAEAADLWRERVGLDMAGVIERVYRRPDANVFLGSLVPLIKELMHLDAVAAMVTAEFDRFFARNVERYAGDCRRLGFVGSIAVHFETVLREASARHGYTIERILGDPLDGLVEYHADPAY